MAHHPAVPLPAALPLAGRERERATLRAALDSALAGRGSLVLIGGEAGIGKTTLAEAALAEASACGALALVGRCYDLTDTPPYGPWREVVERSPGGEGLPALPTALLPPERGGEALTSQDAIIRRTREYFAALAARQPVALLLEDLHWADHGSLDLLRVVGRGLANLPLLLVATYRDDEIAGECALAAALPPLIREARAERLTLARLGDGATRSFVRDRYHLSGEDEARLVRHLGTRAEGNPLYLGELLRALEEAGILQPAPGASGWVLGGLAWTRVPPLLRQIIAARASRLGASSGGLLAVASVIGQEVPLDLWAAAGGAGDEALAEAVGAAVAARMLSEAADGQGVWFAHALVREALYEAIPLPGRRALHRRVAEALLATPHPDPDAVAGHLQRAGDPRAAMWLRQAGDRAQGSFALLTAAERYEAALALQADDDARERARLLISLAQLLRYSAPRRCIPLLEEAARLAGEMGDAALTAVALCDQGIARCGAGELRLGMAQLAEGIAAREALARGDGAGATTPTIHRLPGDEGIGYHRTCLATWQARAGHFAAADRLALVDLPGGTARAHQAMAFGLAAAGQPEAALSAFTLAREAFRATGHGLEEGAIHFQTWLWVGLPYWADRVAWREGMVAENLALHAAWAPLTWRSLQPVGYLMELPLAGEWAAARDLAQRAAADGGSSGIRHFALWAIAPVVRAQGDAALGDDILRSVFPDGPGTEPGGHYFQEAITLQRLAADLALDAGDLATARAWLEAHDRWLAWSGAIPGRAEGRLGWAAFYRAAGDPELARQHAGAALREATAPRQPLALLAAHRLLGELDTAASRRADAQAHLDAALAIADACVAPYERALTLLALAELRAIERQRGAATTLLAEASALLEPLGARLALARTDALAARLDDDLVLARAALPFGLTAREAGVLRLVATGLSDREIADRLSVSVRTVSNHVAHILGKAGVENRTALTALALRHGLA